jgi:hypothetical protein
MTSSPEDAHRIRERRKKATELRLAGVRLEVIAEQLADYGYSSAAHVSMDLKRAREQSVAELNQSTEELRQLTVDRLERLLAAAWPKAVSQKDLKAIETCTRIIERLAKVQGVEAPTQIQLQARIELESTMVVETLLAVVDHLQLPPDKRMEVLDMAQGKLLELAGPDTEDVVA